MSAAARLLKECAGLWAPPPKLSLSEWAEREFQLSSEYSSRTGPFRCIGFQREILDAFTDPRVETVVVMCSTQMVKTLMQQVALGFLVDQDPGPVLMVFPADTDAETFSKERLAPMIRDTPCLHGKVSEVKSRTTANTITHKRFPGGFVALVGAQTPTALARRPIRYLFCDEIDKYPVSAGTEGDPISLALKRTATFRHRRKIVLTCSPTIVGRSRIANAYQHSDRRKPEIPCWQCGDYQQLRWSQVKWDNGLPVEERPATAHYECRSCAAHWSDVQRWRAVEETRWKAERPCTGTAGFWISELYSPWKTLGEIVKDFLSKKDNREQYKVFVTTTLAELWEEPGETPDHQMIFARREDYEIGTVPERALFLTAGVDVQDDRLEAEVVGWGRGAESWSVDYRIVQVMGPDQQPLKTSNPEVWAALGALLAFEYPHATGQNLPIMAMAIDSGFRPKPVYNFALQHPRPAYGPAGMAVTVPRTVMPIKGSADDRRIIAGITKTDAARKRQGVRIVTVGTAYGKQELFDNLRLPRSSTGESAPGYCHFPAYDVGYFEGLCSERKVVTPSGKVTWERMGGARNEALDCRVYARAAAAVFGMDRFGERQWRMLEAGTPAVPARPIIPRVIQAAQGQDPPMAAEPRASRPAPSWFGDRAQNWLRR